MPNQNQLVPVNEAMAKRIEELAKVVRTGTQQEKIDAINELERYGSAAVEVLIAALKPDESYFVRSSAAHALENIGISALPALTEALKDEDSHVRCYAADVLGDIGPSAIPALVEALKDDSVDVRLYAAEALYRLNWHDMVKADGLLSADKNGKNAFQADNFFLYVYLQSVNLLERSPRQYLQFTETFDTLFSNVFRGMLKEPRRWDAELFELVFHGNKNAKGVTFSNVNKEFGCTISLLLAVKHHSGLPKSARYRAKEALAFVSQDKLLISSPRFLNGLKDILNLEYADIKAKKEALYYLAQSSHGRGVLMDELKASLDKDGALTKKGFFILENLRNNAGSFLKEGMRFGLDYKDDGAVLRKLIQGFDSQKGGANELGLLISIYVHDFKAAGAEDLTSYYLNLSDISSPETSHKNDIKSLKNLGTALAYQLYGDDKKTFFDDLLGTLDKNSADEKLLDNVFVLLTSMTYYEQDKGSFYLKSLKELLSSKNAFPYDSKLKVLLEDVVKEVEDGAPLLK